MDVVTIELDIFLFAIFFERFGLLVIKDEAALLGNQIQIGQDEFLVLLVGGL